MRLVVVLGCLLYGASARAQGDGDDPIALALFAEGRQLAAQDDYVHACQKYKAAHDLEPWLGVALNLADCYERTGRTASAWVLFRKASDDADKLGDPRGAFARDRADKLEPQLAHVTIGAAPPSVRILFDGKAIAPAGLGVPLPVDPGDHVIEAAAEGHVSWTTRVTAVASTSVAVAVPPLEAERSPQPPALRSHARPRWAAMIPLGAVGLAAVSASVVIGLDAKHRYDAALPGHCDAQLRCDSQGYSSIRDARKRGDVATFVGGAGVAAIAAAAIVYRFLPVDETIAPMIAPATIGVAIKGTL